MLEQAHDVFDKKRPQKISRQASEYLHLDYRVKCFIFFLRLFERLL